MIAVKPTKVLGVHPTCKGMGWVVLEGQGQPSDWAVVRSTDNRRCIAHIEGFLDPQLVACVVFEEFSGRAAQRGIRVQHLCSEIVRLAKAAGIVSHVYSRSTIQAHFASVGPASRYDIAKVVAKQLSGFDHRLPPRRRPWMGEDARLALFDAAAIAVTHLARRSP